MFLVLLKEALIFSFCFGSSGSVFKIRLFDLKEISVKLDNKPLLARIFDDLIETFDFKLDLINEF